MLGLQDIIDIEKHNSDISSSKGVQRLSDIIDEMLYEDSRRNAGYKLIPEPDNYCFKFQFRCWMDNPCTWNERLNTGTIDPEDISHVKANGDIKVFNKCAKAFNIIAEIFNEKKLLQIVQNMRFDKNGIIEIDDFIAVDGVKPVNGKLECRFPNYADLITVYLEYDKNDIETLWFKRSLL